MYKILYVDDDDCIPYIIKQYDVFKEGTFVISDVASDGRIALDMLDESDYDLVITDIRMPVVDGLELVSQMRAVNNQTLVILASTYTEFQYAQQALKLNVFDYIDKPLTEKKLKLTLDSVKDELDGQRSSFLSGVDVIEFVSPRWLIDMTQAIIFRNTSAIASYVQVEKHLPESGSLLIIRQLILPEIWRLICQDLSWLSFDMEVNFDEKITSLEEGINYIIFILDSHGINQQDELVYRICSAIPNLIQEKDLMNRLSDELELSKDYISRKFRERTGVKLSHFIILSKIELAKKLLLTTPIKVYELCDLLGFSSTDYFTKIFKENVGTTPSKFRRTNN